MMPLIWFALGVFTVIGVQRSWRRVCWDLLSRGDT